MTRNDLWRVRPAQILIVVALVITLVIVARGTHAQNHKRVSMTRDWSDAHIVYSAPSSTARAWRLQGEPRYLRQRTRRNAAALASARVSKLSLPAIVAPRRDWGYPLLATGTSGVGQFPAKFTFDITTAPSCTNDFVVFNQAGLAGVSPTTAATRTGTFAADPPAGRTVTVASPEITLTLTTSTTSNTGLNFLVGGGVNADAANLAAAIARNNAGLGATATSAGAVVTVTALANGQEGNLVSLARTIPAADFTWAAAKLAGGVGRGNIVAFNNLYSTQGSAGGLCDQNGPSIYWSYFTGTGKADTSVVLSDDGTKVAFVEAVAGGAILRILKWQAGEGTGAGYPSAPDITVAPGDTWAEDCTPGNSCISSIAFSGGYNDTGSSPFYDYA
ncbi:MAG: hypothetical protein WA817_02380, partial [Candidatus Acidiferrum sp.]